jgi:hypothetical protein
MLGVSCPALALDWSQPIFDEQGKTIPDCPLAGNVPEPGCSKFLTLGSMTARALFAPDPQGTSTLPEQKAQAGKLGLEIIEHPDMTPTPDQLKMARDAIGKMGSPLAVARGWEILDKAVK